MSATLSSPPASTPAPRLAKEQPLWNAKLLRRALWVAVTRLTPVALRGNPVILGVWACAAVATVLMLADAAGGAPLRFSAEVALWLWITVLAANFSEALAEARGKAQAANLRQTRGDSLVKRLCPNGRVEAIFSSQMRDGDTVVCEAGDTIPGDGVVIAGIATVDESAITGESAPVIRESGGDRNLVTAGTRVLSDRLSIRITHSPDQTFLDHMIALVEGEGWQRTPQEQRLHKLLTGLTLLLAVAALALPLLDRSGLQGVTVTEYIALAALLLPTPIAGLQAAIGLTGMDRLMCHNVLASNGHALEVAGRVTTLLLDKTGTITLGDRQASELLPLDGVPPEEFAAAAEFASRADETTEGRSIVALVRRQFGSFLRTSAQQAPGVVPFSAYTRMSGVDVDGHRVRKGAGESVAQWVRDQGGIVPAELTAMCERIARQGGTPLAVADGPRALGVVHLKDVVKPGLRDRMAELSRRGVHTVMITGDNPLTAAAIAQEAGVDEVVAQATPKDKLEYIKRQQEEGALVAMVGDGTNDAPALAQADIGLAMNSGTNAAKEAGNMVDLDSNPTKLLEVVDVSRQLSATRVALTTFSVVSGIMLCILIAPLLPSAVRFNPLGFALPDRAIVAALIVNALQILVLIPIALRGLPHRSDYGLHPMRVGLVWGFAGLALPLSGVWLVDRLLELLGWR